MRVVRLALALLYAFVAIAPGAATAQNSEGLPTRLRPSAHPKFRWPLIGTVSPAEDGDGIDIVAPVGEAVHAAAEGMVTYAGDELKTYGDLVLIRHDGGYVTAYAHLSEMTVVAGAKVRRGEIIGKSGDTGDVPSPRLHFELRKDGVPVDPIKGYMSPL